MSTIKKRSLDKETILQIYKSKGVIGVINTYHEAEILIIMDDFAEEVDDMIEEESDSMLHDLSDKIKNEL